MQKQQLLFSLLLVLCLAACTTLDTPAERPETADRARVERDQAPGVSAADDSVLTDIKDAATEVTEIIPPAVKVQAPAEQQAEVSATDDAGVPGTKVPAIEKTASEQVVVEGEQEANADTTDPVIELCREVGNKLSSVSVEDCLDQGLVHSAYSTAKRSLAFKEYPPLDGQEPLGRVLVIGGIHGDEFSSVSVLMKWMKILDQHHSGLFHWRFVPTANPDGLLNHKSQRQNINGVDLNRNFPTADWAQRALTHWEQQTHRNPRRHPGSMQASELETQWLVKQIDEFDPDVIISLHAPYHLVDYDGPPTAPDMLGGLYLRKLGVYPGSLGNYAGIDLQMPIVTVELQSAGIMPSNEEINTMWRDLVRWLRVQLSKQSQPEIPVAASTSSRDPSSIPSTSSR